MTWSESPAADARPTIQIVDPFDALSDVGCANKRIADALEVVSDMLHETFSGGIDQTHVMRHLSAAWNVLEMAREYFDATDAKFHAAEEWLYQRGAPRHYRPSADAAGADSRSEP